jgi:hypothetical protein
LIGGIGYLWGKGLKGEKIVSKAIKGDKKEIRKIHR